MKIELHGICKKYGKQEALKDVSLNLEEGIYGLLGKNGAGKTTLISILMGLIKADSGRVAADGRDAAALGARFFGNIGYLPQYPKFYKEFTVAEFMEYMCALKGVPPKEGQRRTDSLLSQVNLLDARKKKIGALSGGMRQRLGIAQAMLNSPGLLVLDEPTAGLDPQERIRFRNLISQFAEGRTVLLVTHIVSDVEYIANQVIIMDSGEVIRQGKAEELERSLDGKVWEVSVEEVEAYVGGKDYMVSNVKREGGKTMVRLIGEGCPGGDAHCVGANLDEVFLYCCKER